MLSIPCRAFLADSIPMFYISLLDTLHSSYSRDTQINTSNYTYIGSSSGDYAEQRLLKYTGWSKKRYPCFIFAITSVSGHRF